MLLICPNCGLPKEVENINLKYECLICNIIFEAINKQKNR